MEKLKTLKDMEFEESTQGAGIMSKVFSEDLKQEAIKWMKKLRTYDGFEEISGVKGGDLFTPELMSAEFGKFFNITEEDLKQWKN